VKKKDKGGMIYTSRTSSSINIHCCSWKKGLGSSQDGLGW